LTPRRGAPAIRTGYVTPPARSPAAALAYRRLRNQRIDGAIREPPSAVVARLGAVQAQDDLGALWAIGLRAGGAAETEVRQAIAAGQIVRTWPNRGTLHFVAAADARWMIELLAPRSIARNQRRQSELGLDAAVLRRAGNVVVSALQGGRQLARSAIYRLLEDSHVATAGQRGYHILWRLGQEGILCFGPPAARQQTFALLEEWAPDARPMAREAALAELARRYFNSRGPATARDFAWWSGLASADARAGVEAAAPRLAREAIDGQVFWSPSDEPATARNPAAAAHLLPPFDEYLLAYKDRTAVLAPEHATLVAPGGNGMFHPIVVVNGRVAGIWKRVLEKDTVTISTTPFASWSPTESRAIRTAAGRYAKFLDRRLVPA
jgi:hypothetical protein